MHAFFRYSLAVLSLSTLGAAPNGIFIEGGYQQGKAQVRMQKEGNAVTTTTPLRGFGLQIGYQAYPIKYVGFKVYGFFDYAHTDGIEFANPNANSVSSPVSCTGLPTGVPGIQVPPGVVPGAPPAVPPVIPPVIKPQCKVNVMGILQQIAGSKKPVQPNMLTYGGGGDIVINIINSQIIALGVLGGVQLAGNSWILATPDFKDVALTYMGLDKQATAFQLLLNVGGRLRILKHSSIEAGIKFPMLKNNPFLQSKNDGTLYIRRMYSWYINYAFTF
ncbi:outer membrane protein [Helicobacter bizzozeronii]|uniref:OMP1469 n=1 Tax=Helicobacter bizzozeronii TaxID=56877 RepID=A0A1M4NHD8_HELBI|nr:outer membrane protein [Helicobacter bizzozeronii]SFZ71949.1 OMP1469 [Helicobacter bizzozeronii]